MLRRAFTLIELMVYCSLLTIISLVYMGSMSHIGRVLLASRKRAETMVRSALASDVLFRDLVGASQDPADWHENEQSFVTESLDLMGALKRTCVCWQVTDKGLVRREGGPQGRGVLVARHVKTCCLSCVLDKEKKRVRAVRVTLGRDFFTVRLRNRELVDAS